MAAYQELKPAFSKKLSGYSPEEVDSYIVPLLKKQNELARENDELKRQLLEALHTLQPARENADVLRNAAQQAQKQAEDIIADAKRQAELLMQTARDVCNAELEKYRTAVEQEMQVFLELRQLVRAYQQTALQQCREQMAQIEHNADRLGTLASPSDADFMQNVLQKIRQDVVTKRQQEEMAQKQRKRDTVRTAMQNERAHATAEQTRSNTVVWTEHNRR